MRTLNSVSEFRTEAANAVFTKQQAISATLQLLTKEWNDPGNTPEEKSVLENAIQRAEFLPIHIRQVGENIPAVGIPFLGGEVFIGYKLVPCNIDLPGGIYRLLRKVLPVRSPSWSGTW